MTVRHAFLWFHRYTGLFMAGFLLLTALTGMLLAFHESLDDWFNQDYLIIETAPNTPPLPITTLHQAVQDEFPNASFSTLPLETVPANTAITFRVDRQRGKKSASKSANNNPEKSVDFQAVYVNPYTAEVIATRNFDEWAWRNTMYKVFWLHRNLLLGDVGKWILGIVALLWTLNCFIGVYLTLPRTVKRKASSNQKTLSNQKSSQQKSQKRASYFKRWLPAWTIRRTRNVFKLSFDAHQALSLWLWLMMFILAWSSVGFNLRSVYEPVMAMVFAENRQIQQQGQQQAQQQGQPQQGQPQQGQPQQGQPKSEKQKGSITTASHRNKPTFSMAQIEMAKQTAQHLATAKGVQIEAFRRFSIDKDTGEYSLQFKTDKDTVGKGSQLLLPADFTANKALHNLPNQQDKPKLGEVKWGFERSTKDTVSMWLVFLHRGFVWGTPYKIFLALVGLAVAIVSATGVYLWWRSRQRENKRAQKKRKTKQHLPQHTMVRPK